MAEDDTEDQFILTIPGLAHDAATALAEKLEEDWRLEPLAVTVNETDESARLWEVTLYFASKDEAAAAARLIAIETAVLTPVPRRDWVRLSLEGLAPVAAGRFYLHGSHDRTRRRDGGVSLEIDAGTAFGTGHHGTTEGCLLALDGILKRETPQRVLDVGCGTGVLAIAAARSCGHTVLASDIDPEAVRVTVANANLNGVGPRIRGLVAAGLSHKQIASEAPFDLIFANILARPLVALARDLTLALAPGGILILSGLTLAQIRWVEASYVNRGLRLERRIARGNWATLVLTRPHTKKRPERRRSGRFRASSEGAGWDSDG